MKTHLTVPVCLLFMLTTLQASPLWTSNRDEEYILSSDKDLSAFSFGLNLERNDREMVFAVAPGAIPVKKVFSYDRYKAYLGADVLSWLTVYGTGGGCRIAIEDFTEFEAGNTEYGAGIRINLLDHIIADPLVIEDKIRLTATVQYTRSSFPFEAIGDKSFDWSERRSVIQFSIVNDIPGNPWFHPESLALNVGFVYSDISGDNELDEVDAGWLMAGVELFYSKHISFDGSVYFSNNNESRGMTAGMHLRF